MRNEQVYDAGAFGGTCHRGGQVGQHGASSLAQDVDVHFMTRTVLIDCQLLQYSGGGLAGAALRPVAHRTSCILCDRTRISRLAIIECDRERVTATLTGL